MDFIMNHVSEIKDILVALFGLAWTIAKVTPTKKDDSVLAKIQHWLSTNN